MKKSITMKAYICAALTFIALTISNSSFGQCVTTASFGAGAVTESFEGNAVSANNPLFSGSNGYTIPGSVSVYTFTTSGLSLTSPIPNNFSNVVLADYAKGSSNFGLTVQDVNSAAYVPSGNAYIGFNNTGVTATFTFPYNVSKVGLLLEGEPGTITLTAYNSSNAVLGTCSTNGTGNAGNWTNNFLGFNSALSDIAYITINGDYVIIDQLAFEAGCPLITLTPNTIPDGVTGTAYTQAIVQTGGVDPSTYALTSSVLPYGLSLSTTGDITGTPTTPGSYAFTITATDANGCTGELSYAVDITCGASTVNLGGPYQQCTGSTVTLDAGNVGSTYIWSDGTTTTQTLDVTTSDTYSVTVTYPNTCTGVGSAVVTFDPLPVVNLGGPYKQCGGLVALNPGFFPNGYVWDDASTNQTRIVDTTGIYTVTVTDANNCSGSGSADVTIDTLPVVDLGGPYVQCQGTVLLDAGSPGSTYEWSDGTTTTQTLTATVTGDYAVTVTDGPVFGK